MSSTFNSSAVVSGVRSPLFHIIFTHEAPPYADRLSTCVVEKVGDVEAAAPLS